MLTHANLLANVRAIGEALGLRNDDVGVSWLPLYHDMGLIGAWLMPLYFGLPVVVLSPLAFLSRPSRWIRAFHGITARSARLPISRMNSPRQKFRRRKYMDVDLSAWRAALNGAEPVQPTTLDRFAARFASCGFRRAALLPVYGLAEASLAVTIPPVGRGPRVDRLERAAFAQTGSAVPAPPPAAGEVHGGASAESMKDDPNIISFVSAGPPVPRHEVRIADERGEDVGERVEGQLWFRGPSATQGYYRNEAATSALLPQGAAAGWVNSGDRAYRAEGEIYITGRVKDIIIHAGHNLYPHEIEDAVAGVPGVRKGCVVAFGAADPGVRHRAPGDRGRIARERSRGAGATRAGHHRKSHRDAWASARTWWKSFRPTPFRKLPAENCGGMPPNRVFSPASLICWRFAGVAAACAPGCGFQRRARRAAPCAAPWKSPMGCYALVMFAVLLLPAWLFVLISPSRKLSARLTTTALRVVFKGRGMARARGGPRAFAAERAANVRSQSHQLRGHRGADGGAGHGLPFRGESRSDVDAVFRNVSPQAGPFCVSAAKIRGSRLHQAEQIEKALRRGESVFVFPEGTFSAQSGVRPFHLGAFKAAITAHREIVPIALDGTRRALRDATWLPRRGKITITICPPIAPPESADDWQQIVRVRDAAREMIAQFAREPLL